MKLTLEGLKEKSSWEAVGVALPSYDVASVAEEIATRERREVVKEEN